MPDHNYFASLIWQIADLLRGPYRPPQYERPLRLRYQMTPEDTARFLDACPHLLDDVQAIDQALAAGTSKLDAMRAATERTIARLKERRSALIAAAVTGHLPIATEPAPQATTAAVV